MKRKRRPAQTEEWQEARDGELGVTIRFDGVDLDEQAALEIENFGRAVKTPEKEDPGGTAMPLTMEDFRGHKDIVVQGMTPMMGARLALGCLLALAGYAAIPDGTRRTLDATAWNCPELLVVGPALLALFVLGALLPSIVAWVRARRAQPLARSTTHGFRLTLSPAQLVVEREGFRLALETDDIERFDGGNRLIVIRRSGDPLMLPCVLKTRRHAPLAARLNELVREHRGYRG